MAVKRRKKRTTKASSAPILPTSLRMTKKKKQKLNKIAMLAMLVLCVNLYVTFFHGENFGSLIKGTATWVQTSTESTSSTHSDSDFSENIHDEDLDDRRAVIVTPSVGRHIPSQYGKNVASLEEGSEVILVKNEGKWWQVRNEFGTLMWINSANLMKN